MHNRSVLLGGGMIRYEMLILLRRERSHQKYGGCVHARNGCFCLENNWRWSWCTRHCLSEHPQLLLGSTHRLPPNYLRVTSLQNRFRWGASGQTMFPSTLCVSTRYDDDYCDSHRNYHNHRSSIRVHIHLSIPYIITARIITFRVSMWSLYVKSVPQ